MKIKPDVIVSWPNNCDYPLWRRFISQERERFNKVIIVITQTNRSPDYSSFIRSNLPQCSVYSSPVIMPGEDWRNVAVNFALKKSRAKWVWFTEQDFLPKEGFWESVDKQILEGCNAVSYYDSLRMHPCCIFAERSLIEKTTKNFGIVPNKLDHFGAFQLEVDELFENEDITLGGIDDIYCDHMNGLSSNWTLVSIGDQPNYQPERFKKYIKDCLLSGMKLHSSFEAICRRFLNE